MRFLLLSEKDPRLKILHMLLLLFSDPVFFALFLMPRCDLASRLSQSVGDWLLRTATFCRILILKDPSFLSKAGAGLKPLISMN